MVETKFKQTEIGLIPEDWEVVRIGEISNPVRGGSPRPAGSPLYFNGNYIPWLTVASLTNISKSKIFVTSTESCLTELGSHYSRNLKKGTLIISNSGATLGVAKILDIDCCGNDGIAALLELNANNKYITYFINTLTDHLRNNIATGNGQPNLNTELIGNLQIPLPPLPEQQAIAEVLSDTDTWIESLEHLIAKKQLIKQGAMQKLLTPKENWEVKKLGEVADFFKGKGLPKNNINSNGNVKCIHYGELFTKHKEVIKKITNKTFNFSSSFLSKENDVLMPTSDVTPRGLATASCINEEGVLLGGDILIIRFKKEIEGSYFSYFVSNNKEEVLKFVSGSTVYHLYGSELSSLIFKYPKSKSEQTRIATILSDMDTEIEALDQKMAKAKQIKQGLMQELLTGKIRLVQADENKEAKSEKGHNEYITDAVLIGTMASCFASEQFPLTRFKYTKVSYLLKRYKEEQTTGYLKKAAGPYNPKTRYGGAEKIAKQNKYVAVKTSTYKGKNYEGFVMGENIDKALGFFKKWYGDDSLEWIKQFKFETNDNLELWATVDMAIQDLKQEKKPIGLETVKQVIKENKEWKDKLKRPAFSDKNIESAIGKVAILYT